ncbi:hypothetical protein BGZ95_000319 [Linnemannia exigua]|uniref:Uncharacterized protein n=1 Tax=Linnemannia exigua TaxID=604196 RepID=A0AAD4DAI5_9FUNG|nr:hypothetical protein BGZ95_000319 [Linnemannia exigua]
MYARNLITIVLTALCALCSFTSFVHAGPDNVAVKDANIIIVTEPTVEAVYKVGDEITVKVSLPGGESNILYQADTPIKLSLQKLIPRPNLNVVLDSVPARTLATTGYTFVALEEYIIDTQVNIPWRIRASFHHTSRSGYVDSRGFKIVKA